MLEKNSNIRKPMNRLRVSILLLTTNLSWRLMKKKALTVLTVSSFMRYDFF